MISKTDMEQTFLNMNLNIDKKSLDYVFNMADVSGDGQITFDEFHRLFEKIIKDAR